MERNMLTAQTESPRVLLWHRSYCLPNPDGAIPHPPDDEGRFFEGPAAFGTQRSVIDDENRQRSSERNEGQHQEATRHWLLPGETTCHGTSGPWTEHQEPGKNESDSYGGLVPYLRILTVLYNRSNLHNG